MEGKKLKKRTVNYTVDTLMLLLLPMLMAYSLIGEKLHEIIGTIMLLLFLVHFFLHLKWWKAASKGRYSPYRVCLTATDVVLLVLMLLQPLSGIAVSKYLYSALPLTGVASQARGIHLVAAYWCYVLMSFHLGLHIDGMIRGLHRKTSATAKWILRALIWGASVYGIYAFVHRGLPGYMFLQTPFAFFDYSEPRVFFFADYLAVMILFAACGHYVGRVLKTLKT